MGVELAAKYGGEIISADSRQVYKGMDIGTGKDLKEYKIKSIVNGQLSTVKIPYHLIDVIGPNTQFSLATYQKMAWRAIEGILERKKLPIIVGGTGLYLQTIVDNYNLSSAKPNKELRKKLERLTVAELFEKLIKLNKKFALKLNNSERNNKRRMIRYVEIISATKKGVEHPIGCSTPNRDYLILGLNWPREILCDRIYKRLIERLEKENMVGEVKRLHREGISWKRLESFGLEYKFVSQYLQKKLTYEEMVEKLNIAIRQFAKRQMSWFRRWERQGKKICWIKDFKEADKITKKFLK